MSKCSGTMATKKFARVANFSTFEEELLISLIKKRKNVIECKKTDGSSIYDKKVAWQCLSKKFNSNSGGPYRTEETLRRKYDNIKKRTKQKYADTKVKIMGTGGGPYEDIPISKVDEEIKEIMGTSVTGLQSNFDDDTNFDLDMSEDTLVLEDNVEAEEEEEEEAVSNYEIITITAADNEQSSPSTSREGTNWSRYTPKMLSSKKAPALQHKSNYDKTGKMLENKLSAWTSGKLELVELQKQSFLDEQEQKMRRAQEKHEEAMEREDREFQERTKALQAEHNLKMEILLLQKKKYSNQ